MIVGTCAHVQNPTQGHFGRHASLGLFETGHCRNPVRIWPEADTGGAKVVMSQVRRAARRVPGRDVGPAGVRASARPKTRAGNVEWKGIGSGADGHAWRRPQVGPARKYRKPRTAGYGQTREKWKKAEAGEIGMTGRDKPPGLKDRAVRAALSRSAPEPSTAPRRSDPLPRGCCRGRRRPGRWR